MKLESHFCDDFGIRMEHWLPYKSSTGSRDLLRFVFDLQIVRFNQVKLIMEWKSENTKIEELEDLRRDKVRFIILKIVMKIGI